MTPLSKWRLTSEEENKVKDTLTSKLVKISDEKEMKSLLERLISESEYLMLSKRLVAFVLIDEGYSDVQIAKILHFTRATANRLRIIYKHARELNEPVVKLVKEVKASEELKKILQDILFKYLLPAAFGKIPLPKW